MKEFDMYLKSIKFVKDERCFKKNEQFLLESLTLLVGDQGSGKSTILESLQELSAGKSCTIEVSLFNQNPVDVFYFDTERHNPRIKNPIHYTNIDGTSRGIGLGNALSSRFMSHGETLVVFTVEAIKKAENCIVLLDEPESGLSLRNQYRLTDEIIKAVERNCQFIISTHCLPLIEKSERVLSLEHKQWMESNDFIKSQIA